MTFEMYNNYFYLVHNFCVIFYGLPGPWPSIVVVVLVLKESLRTKFKYLSWSLTVKSWSWSLHEKSLQNVLVAVLQFGMCTFRRQSQSAIA